MFNGWLIKFGDIILPNSFIMADGWESIPNQRVEVDAFRDANVLLHRETSENFKTKLTLNIREMNLAERRAFDAVIGLATLSINDKKQRRLMVTYWNDEDLEYKDGIMYMTDTTYTIHTVNEVALDINYNGFTIELIEY